MAFETTEELATLVESELGHTVHPSSQRSDIESHLDRAHKVVLSGGGFLNRDDYGKRMSKDAVFAFARAPQPKVVTLVPPIDTILATTTQGSTTVTLSGAPQGANSVAGWFIQVMGTSTAYRIQTHVAASTTVTLDSAYVDLAATNEVCSIFKLQYTLGGSDILRLIGPLRIYGDEPVITITDKDEMLDRIALDGFTLRVPEYCSVINEDNGTYTLQFSSTPSEYVRIEADYVPIPGTLTGGVSGTNPVIPRQFRELLAHVALYFMQIRNDDNRANTHLKIAQDMFAELIDWNDKLYAQGDADYGRVIIAKRYGI
jgi:hypothetical protein